AAQRLVTCGQGFIEALLIAQGARENVVRIGVGRFEDKTPRGAFSVFGLPALQRHARRLLQSLEFFRRHYGCNAAMKAASASNSARTRSRRRRASASSPQRSKLQRSSSAAALKAPSAFKTSMSNAKAISTEPERPVACDKAVNRKSSRSAAWVR